MNTLDASVVAQLLASDSIYFSNRDFTATFASVTQLTLAGLPFLPDSYDFIGVWIPTDGNQRFYHQGSVSLTFTSTGAGAGTLDVPAATLASFGSAAEDFVVFLRGQKKGYNAVAGNQPVENVNPFWEEDQYVLVADVTDGEDDTYNYYLDMEGYRHFSTYFNLDNGSGTCTLKVYASLQNDGTAPGSCTYTDVGNDWFGAASWVGTSDFLEMDVPVSIKYLKFEVVAATGAADDADWYIETIKTVS